MSRVTFPTNITLDNWAASFETNFPKGNVPPIKSFPNWQAWARFITGLPYFAGYRIPPPNHTETWQQWVTKLIQVVYV